MAVSVVAIAQSDGSQYYMVNFNMTTTVSCSLLITLRSITDQSKDIADMSCGIVIGDLTLEITGA